MTRLLSAFIIGIFLLCLTMFSGCRTFTPPAQSRTIGSADGTTMYFVHYEATRRGTYVLQGKDGTIRIAAEPPPDAAMDATVDLAATLSSLVAGMPVEGELDVKVVEEIVQLTERTQAVVLMRDAMFRLAEMHINEVIDDETYRIMYNKTLAGALALAASDSELAEKMLRLLLAERVLESLTAEQRQEMLLQHLGRIIDQDLDDLFD